jgi:hypothetical protein
LEQGTCFLLTKVLFINFSISPTLITPSARGRTMARGGMTEGKIWQLKREWYSIWWFLQPRHVKGSNEKKSSRARASQLLRAAKMQQKL